MKIIQAPAVSAEVHALLAEKARVQADLDVLLAETREKAASLSDMQIRLKSFEDSFIGDSEWLKKITELRKLHKEEKQDFQRLQDEKERAQTDITDLLNKISHLRDVENQQGVLVGDRQKQFDDLQVENERLSAEIQDKSKKISISTDQLGALKSEKLLVEADLVKMKDEYSKREQEMAKKELDLKVYEQRIIREYAVLFPSVEIK